MKFLTLAFAVYLFIYFLQNFTPHNTQEIGKDKKANISVTYPKPLQLHFALRKIYIHDLSIKLILSWYKVISNTAPLIRFLRLKKYVLLMGPEGCIDKKQNV